MLCDIVHHLYITNLNATIFQFNDILIYASSVPPANTTFKVIKRIPLEGMLVEPLNDPEMKYGFQIISTCKSFRLEARYSCLLNACMAKSFVKNC